MVSQVYCYRFSRTDVGRTEPSFGRNELTIVDSKGKRLMRSLAPRSKY